VGWVQNSRASDIRAEGAARRERSVVVDLGAVQTTWGILVRGSGREIGLLDESAAVMRRVRSSLAAVPGEEGSSVKWILMTSVIRARAVSPMVLGAGAGDCLRWAESCAVRACAVEMVRDVGVSKPLGHA